MKKILITGSNGFVGSSIVASFSKEAVEVYGMGRKNNTTLIKPENYYRADITDSEKIETIIAAIKPDVIIHLAAIVHKNNEDVSEKNYMKINCEGSLNLFELADKYHVKKVIFASTIEVYGANEEQIITKDSRCLPNSFYGKSKYLVEEALNKNNYKFNYFILRFSPVYGESFTLNIDKRVVLLKGKLGYYFKKGNYTFDFCSVYNIVNLLHYLVNNEVPSLTCIVNDKKNYEVKEIIQLYKTNKRIKTAIKMPYYLTMYLLVGMGYIISLVKKGDIYLSKRNFDKLFASKKYDTNHEFLKSELLYTETMETTLGRDKNENISH